jgi:hypothetical protein
MPLTVDCVAGAIAGASGILLGHPLDTVRVRLQTHSGVSSAGTLVSIVRSLQRERGFYRGVLPPLLSVGVASSLAFSCNEGAKRVLAPTRLETWRHYLALAGSGTCWAVPRRARRGGGGGRGGATSPRFATPNARAPRPPPQLGATPLWALTSA